MALAALCAALCGCGAEKSPQEGIPQQEPPAQALADAPVINAQPDIPPTKVPDSDPHPTPESVKLSFCGLSGSGDTGKYKLYDWEQSLEVWVEKGESYRGFRVVGLDDSAGKETLVLESGEFWYLYPLEALKLREPYTGPKVSVLHASDIPEGVSIMDYVIEHTEPLNPGVMPDDLPVLNPDVNMDDAE